MFVEANKPLNLKKILTSRMIQTLKILVSGKHFTKFLCVFVDKIMKVARVSQTTGEITISKSLGNLSSWGDSSGWLQSSALVLYYLTLVSMMQIECFSSFSDDFTGRYG